MSGVLYLRHPDGDAATRAGHAAFEAGWAAGQNMRLPLTRIAEGPSGVCVPVPAIFPPQMADGWIVMSRRGAMAAGYVPPSLDERGELQLPPADTRTLREYGVPDYLAAGIEAVFPSMDHYQQWAAGAVALGVDASALPEARLLGDGRVAQPGSPHVPVAALDGGLFVTAAGALHR